MADDKLNEIKAHLLSRAAEDDDFRSCLLEDPKAAIAAEFGVPVPDNLSFNVHEDTATTAHLIPAALRPPGRGGTGGRERRYRPASETNPNNITEWAGTMNSTALQYN